MDDPEVLNDLFLQAERGKKTLTQREKAPFRVTHAGQQARVELERTKFEEITQHLLDRTIELTREMLAEANAKGDSHFDKIILVGGATRMPQVRDRIVAEFKLVPEIFDPDEAVAKGAALFGLKESLQDEVKEILVPTIPKAEGQGGQLDLDAVNEAQVTEALDHLEQQLGFTLTGPVRELVNTRIVNVLSKSLGVVARDDRNRDVVVYLLPRNGEVPMEQSSDFGTDSRRPDGRGHPRHGWRARQPRPARLQGRRHRDPEPPRRPARAEPDPRQVRDRPRRPVDRHRHRPDRRRLDRRRVRDRGRHERRGGRRAVVGPAVAERLVIREESPRWPPSTLPHSGKCGICGDKVQRSKTPPLGGAGEYAATELHTGCLRGEFWRSPLAACA